MFQGPSQATIDAKGRMALPSRVRDQLTAAGHSQLIVTADFFEPCLTVYVADYWRTTLEPEIAGMPTFDPWAKKLSRFLIGMATEMETDGNGRILMTAPLREHAMLNKKVQLLGQGNKLEIWSEECWNARKVAYSNEPFSYDSLPDFVKALKV